MIMERDMMKGDVDIECVRQADGSYLATYGRHRECGVGATWKEAIGDMMTRCGLKIRVSGCSPHDFHKFTMEAMPPAQPAAAPSRPLEVLARQIREINKANGWNVTQSGDWEQTYKIPAFLALIHSEVSEALEAFRKNDLANFGEELADILIRVLDLAGGVMVDPDQGLDIDQAVTAKLEVNSKRGYRHGGKRL